MRPVCALTKPRTPDRVICDNGSKSFFCVLGSLICRVCHNEDPLLDEDLFAVQLLYVSVGARVRERLWYIEEPGFWLVPDLATFPKSMKDICADVKGLSARPSSSGLFRCRRTLLEGRARSPNAS